MRVKLSGNAKQPSVNTFAGTGQVGEQVLDKWWKLPSHAILEARKLSKSTRRIILLSPRRIVLSFR
jgi:hypothetical protein